MRSFKNLGFIMTLFAVLFMISCEDDGTGGGTGGGGGTEDAFPVVSVSGPGVTTSAEVGDTTYYTITATEGDDELNAITVNGGATLDALSDLSVDRILVDDVSPANNPFTLSGTDRNMFEKVIGIINSADQSFYQIIITDAANRTVTSDFQIVPVLEGPTLSTTMMSGAVDLAPGTLGSFPLTGVIGDGRLDSITVFEGSEIIDPTNGVFFNNEEVTTNPFAISEDLKDGFEVTAFQIRSSTELGSKTYRIVLTDENGLSSEITQVINTVAVGTDVDAEMGVFFNRSGQSFGSFDFETNMNVASSNTDADIRDLGIVSDVDPTWIQAIESVNGATLKKVVEGMGGIPEGFSFDNIQFKEELAGLFDGAITYSSETVESGDVFAVLTATGTLAVFRVAAVNVTTGNNDDNYEIDIKK